MTNINIHAKKGCYKKKDLNLLGDLVVFARDYLLSKKLAKTVKISIELHKKLKPSHISGACTWADSNFRPREFTIVLRTKGYSVREVLDTLAHELVHMKQFTTGHMFQYKNAPHLIKWNNKIYDMDEDNYWEFPWEIEANGWQKSLIAMFVSAHQHNHKKWERPFLQETK